MLAIMFKLRRDVNQTLQGAPRSCVSPRILPLAPCVPPEDVPPTRIPRTARDGAQSAKPWATGRRWCARVAKPLRVRRREAQYPRVVQESDFDPLTTPAHGKLGKL